MGKFVNRVVSRIVPVEWLSRSCGLTPLDLFLWSYVSPAICEPLPGWVDNLNGPTGLMVGAGKGVIRSILINKNNQSEVIPVDYAINGLIVIAYEFNREQTRPSQIPVYNITNADHRKVSWGYVIEKSKRIGLEYPLNMGLWYPDPCITTNRFYNTLNVLLFQWLPAYFIDFLLLIFGQKRFMVRVQKKIATGMSVLEFFTLTRWTFKSQRFAALWEHLGKSDKEIFNMDMNSEVDDDEFMVRCAKGARLYLLKESIDSLPRARLHIRIMYYVDRICKTLIVSGLLYWLLSATGILAAIFN